MNYAMLNWPYAAKATVQHEFDTDHLNIWVTFRHTMDQTVKPAHGLWLCKVDEVIKAITVSAWQDDWTLLLTVPIGTTIPQRVLLKYDGPDENLKTVWNKQWEPWGYILSLDVTTYAPMPEVPAGTIILWSGAIVDIPSGFVLCDGNNNTPNLVSRFIPGAGDTYAVDETGGSATHTHTDTFAVENNVEDVAVQSGSGIDVAESDHGHALDGSINAALNVPPFYALCYIMKT